MRSTLRCWQAENYVSEDEVLQDLEQRVDWELRSFAEKADLEVRLRGRGADGITNTERKRIIQEERANYWQLHKQYQEETRQRIAEERGKRHASEREAREKINNHHRRGAGEVLAEAPGLSAAGGRACAPGAGAALGGPGRDPTAHR